MGIPQDPTGGKEMKLQGLKINFLGDSITEGCGTSGRDACFTERMKQKYGLACSRNYGIGGTRYAHQAKPSENPVTDLDFCIRAQEMDPDADVVVVFGGTNDYGHGDAPFGGSADRTADTFWGACHELYTILQERFPQATILIVTPIHRTQDESSRGDGREQAPRPPLREYVRVIRETAQMYGLPVLNLFDADVLNPNYPQVCAQYVPDGLHPNDAGHIILAQEIGACLEAL